LHSEASCIIRQTVQVSPVHCMQLQMVNEVLDYVTLKHLGTTLLCIEYTPR